MLISVLLIIVILPFVVHLAVYSCGYSGYDWYADNDLIADFYCCYKCYYLETVSAFATRILVFRFVLYRILEHNDREPLTFMTIEADGIHMGYDGVLYGRERDGIGALSGGNDAAVRETGGQLLL